MFSSSLAFCSEHQFLQAENTTIPSSGMRTTLIEFNWIDLILKLLRFTFTSLDVEIWIKQKPGLKISAVVENLILCVIEIRSTSIRKSIYLIFNTKWQHIFVVNKTEFMVSFYDCKMLAVSSSSEVCGSSRVVCWALALFFILRFFFVTTQSIYTHTLISCANWIWNSDRLHCIQYLLNFRSTLAC